MNPYFVQTLENFGQVARDLLFYTNVEADDRVRIVSNNLVAAEEKFTLVLVHLQKSIDILNGSPYNPPTNTDAPQPPTSLDKAYFLRERTENLYEQIACNYNPRKQMPQLSLHIGATLQYLTEAVNHITDYIEEITPFYDAEPVKGPALKSPK